MNILILHNKFPYPAKDGGSIAVLNLAKALGQIGHQITFLCFNTSKHYFNPNQIPEELKRIIDFKTVDLKSEINPWKAVINFLFSRKPFISVRFKTKAFSKQLEHMLLNNHFDFIQVEGLYMCSYIPLIRKISPAKIAYRAHNIENEIWARTVLNTKNRLKKFYLKNLTKRLKRFELETMNAYDLLIPISDRDESIFNQMGNKMPSKIIIPGIELNKEIGSESEFLKNLFFLGALDWKPNQEGLVWFFEQVWTELLLKYSGIELSIAGRNCPNWLEKFIQKQKNVRFLGEIENAADFVSSNGIMLVPLLSGSGIRVKIIEGMAYGKIMITTSIGAEGLHIEDQQNIFIANKPDEFVRAIDAVFNMNDSLIFKIQENARNFYSKNFDNLASAKKLSEFYMEHLI